MEHKQVSPVTKILVTGVSLCLVVLLLLLVVKMSTIAYELIFSKMGANESFFVCLGIFIFTFLVVNFFALGPTSRMLVERDKRMAGREKEIVQIREELYESNKALSEERKIAQLEASERFSEIKSRAVDEQRRTLQEARDQAAGEMKKLKEKLQQDFDSEKAELDAQSGALMEQIFASLLKSASSQKGTVSNVRTGA